MTSIAPAPVDRSRRTHTHCHLWSLPDGTGLHAPYGQLVVESGTGRVCCHLCGRWFVSLGGHLRRHGHTAESYRAAMGLCRGRPLVAAYLSQSIATRQSEAYRRSPALRARLAVGQELSRTGTSLRGVAKATGFGWVRLRRELDAAGIAVRPASAGLALMRQPQDSGNRTAEPALPEVKHGRLHPARPAL
ncbi:MAG: MucR family transcriptional regulator [Pseudonocardiaceae bacterium]